MKQDQIAKQIYKGRMKELREKERLSKSWMNGVNSPKREVRSLKDKQQSLKLYVDMMEARTVSKDRKIYRNPVNCVDVNYCNLISVFGIIKPSISKGYYCISNS